MDQACTPAILQADAHAQIESAAVRLVHGNDWNHRWANLSNNVADG